MNKAIMISDKPRWCALMMNGDKTVEVRTSKALAKAIQKLGKLEDAEEELGVDLVKLLNNTHVKHILKSIVNDKKFHL